jgi:hypothetical protein
MTGLKKERKENCKTIWAILMMKDMSTSTVEKKRKNS